MKGWLVCSVHCHRFVRFSKVGNNHFLVKTYGGKTMIESHGGSLFQALETIYPGTCSIIFPIFIDTSPERKWYAWKFAHVPRSFWQDQNNVKNYMKWLQVHIFCFAF